MEIVHQLQKQFVDYSNSLYREGFLDEQFVQLQKLQDESNPDFVGEVISLFLVDSDKLLHNMAIALQQQVVDFKQVDAYVHQFKGSSSSIGAQRVKNMCVPFGKLCEQKNLDGCMSCLQQITHEYYLVKNKLETLFRLERQILEAGGTVPTVA
ncbi:peroxiredoxin type-2 [Castilleja foliolosa]|uniref:Histidine-containing phosphotransfer protein n=1 Tax=Castilleja foliolosa TaxID=1961234 RepID=A0ABD3E7P4_9LAMI